MLYDFERRKYYHYNLVNDSIRYSLYDYDRGSYLQGNLSQLFDTKTQSYISVKLESNKFYAFDRRSGSYLYGNINNNFITVYDTQKADIFNILFSDCNKFIIITSNQKFLWEISYSLTSGW